jgi:nucleotide-binding universal stress UspA family protein
MSLAHVWKPVLVGVDASAASARAAALGVRIARRAGTECRLVHVMPDYIDKPYAVLLPLDFAALHDTILKRTRREIEATLRDVAPGDGAMMVELRGGHPGHVLCDLSLGSELVVVGGKRHSALERWLVGSTAHQLARGAHAPVLIAVSSILVPRRILLAVDLSRVAVSALRAATRMAGLFGAELRLLHVVEPVPVGVATAGATYDHLGFGLGGAPVPPIDPETWFTIARDRFERVVWPQVAHTDATRLVVRGDAETEIRREVTAWQADLLVVGSHGKNVMDRLLLGSVTHRLLADLPASVMVVPPGVEVEASGIEAAVAAEAS